jgi:hypothetical protein
MEMTLESLMASGLSQDQAKQVLEAHKAAVSGSYVPKARFDEVNTQLTNANAQVKERDTQIAGLKKFEGDNAALQTRISELETANQTKDNEMKAALAKERKSNAMRLSLAGKVHDADLVLSQIDTEKVAVGDDGKLTGFDEQVKALQESKKFLFVEETPKANPYAGFRVVGKTPPEGGDNPPAEQNTPEAFGANLAKRKMAAADAAKKAQDHYFKGGN